MGSNDNIRLGSPLINKVVVFRTNFTREQGNICGYMLGYIR